MKRARWFLAAACAAVAVAAEARDAEIPAAPKDGFYVVTYIDVAEAAIPQTMGALKTYSETLGSAGNRNVDLYEEIDQADHFVIIEQWPDRKTYEAQKSGSAAAALTAALKTMQSAPPDTHVFEAFSTGPMKSPAGGRARVYGIGTFEVAADRLAAVKALAAPLAETSRSDPGFMRFDVFEEAAPHRTGWLILDAWSSPQDFEKHRTAAHAVTFREGVAKALTAPFQDRVYGKFN